MKIKFWSQHKKFYLYYGFVAELKHEPLLWTEDETMLTKSSKGTNTHCSQGLFTTGAGGAGTMTIEDSVKEAMEYLVRHRKDAKRPETLEVHDLINYFS